jgi:hypothetical protein
VKLNPPVVRSSNFPIGFPGVAPHAVLIDDARVLEHGLGTSGSRSAQVPSTALRGTNWRCSKPTLSMPIV